MMLEDDNRMRVYFTIENYGQSHSFNAVLDEGTTWDEVLDKVVRTLEASYGYSFDLEDNYGIYYKGKNND